MRQGASQDLIHPWVSGWPWAAALTLTELFSLGWQPWWWKLHWSLWKNFRGLDIGRVVAEHGGDNPGEFSYGETPVLSASKLLAFAPLMPGSRVLDLGCGRGLVVLTAALMGFRAVGLERVSEYLVGAREVAEELGLQADFLEANMLESDWPPAELVFINSTAFPAEFRQGLLQRLEGLASGTVVTTYDWPLPKQNFEELKAFRLPVTWGTVRCGIFRRS